MADIKKLANKVRSKLKSEYNFPARAAASDYFLSFCLNMCLTNSMFSQKKKKSNTGKCFSRARPFISAKEYSFVQL